MNFTDDRKAQRRTGRASFPTRRNRIAITAASSAGRATWSANNGSLASIAFSSEVQPYNSGLKSYQDMEIHCVLLCCSASWSTEQLFGVESNGWGGGSLVPARIRRWSPATVSIRNLWYAVGRSPLQQIRAISAFARRQPRIRNQALHSSFGIQSTGQVAACPFGGIHRQNRWQTNR